MIVTRSLINIFLIKASKSVGLLCEGDAISIFDISFLYSSIYHTTVFVCFTITLVCIACRITSFISSWSCQEGVCFMTRYFPRSLYFCIVCDWYFYKSNKVSIRMEIKETLLYVNDSDYTTLHLSCYLYLPLIEEVFQRKIIKLIFI